MFVLVAGVRLLAVALVLNLSGALDVFVPGIDVILGDTDAF